MERLTKWNNKLGRYTANNDTGTSMQRNHLLGQYEDTGLTPEEIMELKEMATPKMVELINGGKAACPFCSAYVYRHYDYCTDCGQRLKWEQ